MNNALSQFGYAALITLTSGLIACGPTGPDGDPLGDADDDGGVTTSGECPTQASGTSGTRITALISWPDSIGLVGGSAEMLIWTRAELTFDGNEVSGSVTPCGSELPPLQTKAVAGGGKVQPVIPDSVWDSASMPKTAAHGTISGFGPGSTVAMDPVGATVGLVMADAVNDSWPSSWQGIETADHDGTGHPGITSFPMEGDGFQLPPLGLFPTDPKAEALYLVTRSVVELQGERDSCTHASGTALMTKFDNHVVGCRIQGGGECNADQVEFVDSNRVVYTIESATYEMQQVPDGASCADVRAALP